MAATVLAVASLSLVLLRQTHARLDRDNTRLRRQARFQELWRQTASHTNGTVTNILEQPFDWRMVESSDYPTYVANLRAVGCPEATIRDIIIADVNELFAYRLQALRGAGKRFEYWKAKLDSTIRTALDGQQDLAKEKCALLQELLGVEPAEDREAVAGKFQGDVLLFEDFLPPAKAAEAGHLLLKHRASLPRLVLTGNFSQFRKAELALETELATVLTPQELEEYRLRSSFPARSLRLELAPFEPSEQEFREIFKLWRNYGEEITFGGASPKTDASCAKPGALRAEAKVGIKALLGEQRYAEYERSTDPAYAAVYHATEGQGLPKDALVRAYEIESAAFVQRVKLDNDESLSPEQRNPALATLRAEADAALSQILGPKAVRALRRYSPYYNAKVTITKSSRPAN